jgi:PTH1 family peptidyl-tRNA hydrolase
MKVVIGLGNPGSQYQFTRHNIGWLVLDAVAESLRAEFRPGKGEFYEARGRWRGHDVLLVKPTTYMNNSGVAARQIVDRLGASPAEMLAITDEIQFPTGRVQLKPSGSSGGHNGVESLIYHLRTADFPRLRCGVGNDFPRGAMADYVLSSFPMEELNVVQEMIEEGREFVLTWIAEGTAQTMSRLNNRKKRPDSDDPGTERRTEEGP